MKAKEFSEMCYAEKEIQLKEYMNVLTPKSWTN